MKRVDSQIKLITSILCLIVLSFAAFRLYESLIATTAHAPSLDFASNVRQGSFEAGNDVSGVMPIGVPTRMTVKATPIAGNSVTNSDHVTFEILQITSDENLLEYELNTLGRANSSRNGWVVDNESIHRKIIDNANYGIFRTPEIKANANSEMTIDLIVPTAIISGHEVVSVQGGMTGVRPILKTIDQGAKFRMKVEETAGLVSVHVQGHESMASSLSRQLFGVSRGNMLGPMNAVYIKSEPGRVDFETDSDLALGKSLVVKLGKTIEETQSNSVLHSFLRRINRKHGQKKTQQRYLMITPLRIDRQAP
jgi:hypothetical protein